MSEHRTKRLKPDNDFKSTPKITDPRFANIQNDPRYRLPGKKQKVKLDKRFARALQDDDFTRKAKVDRYGRPIAGDAERKRLERKYQYEENESDDPDDDDEVQKELQKFEKAHDPLREGQDVESSSDETSSDEEEEDEEVEGDVEVGQDQVDVPTGEVTARVAAVNLDWDNIRVEDLMAVVSSFVPAGGRLLKVDIYPSQFGKERMEREELEGPPQEIFATSRKDREEEALSDSEEDDEAIKEAIVKTDEGTEFDSTALRRYQRERLGYFYAVLNFSSSEVAKAVYDLVDGTEYMNSANFFDLRFIPEDTDFSDDKPRDECDRLPEGYKPNTFVTDALQHSKVKLTWDAEDATRKEAQSRAFRGSRKEIDENDLKAYLGSDSSDEGEPDHADKTNDNAAPQSKKDAERQRMRALLGLAPEPQKPSKSSQGPVGNVQITFSSGLSNTNADGTKRSVFENSPEPDETTAEKYVRKERERKQKRKERLKSGRNDQPHDEHTAEHTESTKQAVQVEHEQDNEDMGFDDPFFAEPDSKSDATSAKKLRKEERLRKKTEREAEEAASAKQRAELELLMADNKTAGEAGLKHFDMNEIEKAEKRARKDGKKKNKKSKGRRNEDSEGGAVQHGFKIDVGDERFKRVFEDHEFAVDPTNPRFKDTSAMRELLGESRKRKDKRTGGGKEVGRDRKTADVDRLVEKLKKRQVPS